MVYMWTVKILKETGIPDRAQYNVAARTAKEAINKAVRQAQCDIGYKRPYVCVFLERSDTFVVV